MSPSVTIKKSSALPQHTQQSNLSKQSELYAMLAKNYFMQAAMQGSSSDLKESNIYEHWQKLAEASDYTMGQPAIYRVSETNPLFWSCLPVSQKIDGTYHPVGIIFEVHQLDDHTTLEFSDQSVISRNQVSFTDDNEIEIHSLMGDQIDINVLVTSCLLYCEQDDEKSVLDIDFENLADAVVDQLAQSLQTKLLEKLGARCPDLRIGGRLLQMMDPSPADSSSTSTPESDVRAEPGLPTRHRAYTACAAQMALRVRRNTGSQSADSYAPSINVETAQDQDSSPREPASPKRRNTF